MSVAGLFFASVSALSLIAHSGESLEAPEAASVPRRVQDAKLIVQLDWENLTETSRPEMLAKMEAAGADGLEVAFIEFFKTGESRATALGKLAKDLQFFGRAGFEPTVWTTTYGYAGNGGYPDFVRRFSGCRMMRDFDGKERSLVCLTDGPYLDAVCENMRDLVRIGAKFILLDDDLVQATRPLLGCTCDEHLRRVAAKVGRPSVSALEVRASFTGAPNPIRSAFVDVLGETLTEVCRRIRAAVDEVDPSVGIGLCLSDTMWDMDGADIRAVLRLLAGPGRRPFVRVSGAPYWVANRKKRGGRRFPGQGLGAVIEFVRAQQACLAGSGFTVCDENDTCPRNDRIVPAALCELYDKATVANGGLVRMKYILRGDLSAGEIRDVDPAYLAAHLKGQADATRIADGFRGLKPFGFRVWRPERLVREETLPEEFLGGGVLKALFTHPMAGVLLSANGAPVQYTEETPGVAFGRVSALSVPPGQYVRGLVLDRDGARALEERGVELGRLSPDVRRIGDWTLCRSKAGRFAIIDRSWYTFDYSERTPTSVPVSEIWRFFTGEPLPVSVPGGRGLFVLAAEDRSSGRIQALLGNAGDEADAETGLGPYGYRMTTIRRWRVKDAQEKK